MPSFLRRRTASRRARPARVWRGLEPLEARCLMAAVPLGAAPTDTAEYMLGDVTVKVVFIESAAGNPQNNENWDAATIARVKGTIERGLQWWEDTLHAYYPGAYLDFHIDFSQADNPFTVAYEPIKRTSDQTSDFVNEFLASNSFPTGGPDAIYAYNNQLRIDTQSNWAFTIFVVNDEQDLANSPTGNGGFAIGGAFSQSFAYPGGRYVVTLSDRPDYIIAHEAGHMFYALDEYSLGDFNSTLRGYYNQQNTNGKNGAPSGFNQENSVMSSGFPQQDSYSNHSLPLSTQANIGWRDSDGDSLIDIVDVNHTLTGYGYRDALTGNYRFVGQSQVRALPNLNSVGNKNDIAINRIRVAEYSLDNGATWQVAANYDTYSADLDLTIPLAGAAQIKIRTRDTTTNVKSDVFTAPTDRMSSTTQPGINGVVFNDTNSNGVWDAGESTLTGRSIYLVNQAGQAISGPVLLDPSNYAANADLTNAIPQVTLQNWVNNAPSGTIIARDNTATAARTFGSKVSSTFSSFFSGSKQLRMDFNTPVRQISLDAINLLSGTSYGRLDAYDANGVLLARYTSGPLEFGETETMTVGSSTTDIAYALAYGHARTNIALDRLTIGAAVATTTDAHGAFSLPNLTAGTYYVQGVAPTDWAATTPATGRQQITVTSGQPVTNVNFGQHATTLRWHNNENQFDVNNDGDVTPLDALLVINYLNAVGPRDLIDPPSGEGPPRFVDINGDGSLSPLDALQVIIYLNSGGAGEAYVNNGGTSGNSGTGDAGGAAVAGQGELTVSAFAEAVTGSVANAAAPRLGSALFEVSTLNGAQSLSPAPTNESALRSMSNSNSAPLVARQIHDAAIGAWRLGATTGRPPGNLITENWEAPWKRKASSSSAIFPAQAAGAPFEAEYGIDEATYARLAADVAAARTRQEVTRFRTAQPAAETAETPPPADQTPTTDPQD